MGRYCPRGWIESTRRWKQEAARGYWRVHCSSDCRPKSLVLEKEKEAEAGRESQQSLAAELTNRVHSEATKRCSKVLRWEVAPSQLDP